MSKKSVQNQPAMLNDIHQLFVDLSKGLDEPSPVTLLLVEQVADALYWARQHAIDKELMIINVITPKTGTISCVYLAGS